MYKIMQKLAFGLIVFVVAIAMQVGLVKYTQPNRYTTSLAYLARANYLQSTELSLAEDADKDGVSDRNETQLIGSDPQNPDTDNDGYTDLTEIINCYGTNSKDKTKEYGPETPVPGKIRFKEVARLRLESLRFMPDNLMLTNLDAIVGDFRCVELENQIENIYN
jgi:hypothetical protein